MAGACFGPLVVSRLDNQLPDMKLTDACDEVTNWLAIAIDVHGAPAFQMQQHALHYTLESPVTTWHAFYAFSLPLL
jgi:hypothetical protein